MRKAGFKLAIDDFGVGHGEMKLLCDYPRRLPQDRPPFHRRCRPQRRASATCVKNIVNIAHVLGIRVIAEGIETEAEFLACREYGVDLVQGWFIARPTTHFSRTAAGLPASADTRQRTRRYSQSLDEILIRKQIEMLPTVYENDSIDSGLRTVPPQPAPGAFSRCSTPMASRAASSTSTTSRNISISPSAATS